MAVGGVLRSAYHAYIPVRLTAMIGIFTPNCPPAQMNRTPAAQPTAVPHAP